MRLSVCDGDLIAGSKGWPFPVFIFLSLAVHGGGKAVPTLGRLDTQLARDFSTPLDAKVRGSKHNPPLLINKQGKRQEKKIFAKLLN